VEHPVERGDEALQRDGYDPLNRLSEWATDITGLTWSDGTPLKTISHAIALDFPYCCRRN